MMFKELVHRIVDRSKNEPYFRWPNKIWVDLSRRNQNLYYTYRRGEGHTTEQCRVLKDHLEQLVRTGYLKEFVMDLRNQETRQGARPQENPLPPPLGVIEVIHAASRGTLVTQWKGVLTVVLVESCQDEQPSKKKLKFTWEPINFNDDYLEGTIQPHDNPLVVTVRINGFIVKRVLVNQGSGAKWCIPTCSGGLVWRMKIFLSMIHP